ncbi:hypothetical protein [Halopseudomonas sp.]|uniref:hypothetical protein n=1 Tax=Halopseudomonas sp. TaxID=2901191 RepID=UPI003566825C
MQYYGLAGLVLVIVALILLAVLRAGWRLSWLLPWLKGNLLLLGVMLAGALAIVAWELQQFKALEPGSNVATLEFRKMGPQQFELLFSAGTEPRSIMLEGDMWQLDAQVLRWQGLAHAIGLQDGYRLHRLTGRYRALEQQREVVPVAHAGVLHATPGWRDAWQWLDHLDSGALLETDAFVVRFIPMAEGARFGIEIGETGLTPVPMNRQAMNAMQRSQ